MISLFRSTHGMCCCKKQNTSVFKKPGKRTKSWLKNSRHAVDIGR